METGDQVLKVLGSKVLPTNRLSTEAIAQVGSSRRDGTQIGRTE